MKKRILLIVFFLLLSYIFLFEVGKKKKTEWELEPLFHFSAKEIYKLKLNHITLTKKNKTWYIVSPIKDLADRKEINEVLNKITNLLFFRCFKVEKNSSLSQFGLDKPRIKVKIGFYNNLSDVSFFIGKRNPEDSCVYLMKKNDKNIYLVDKDVEEVLKKNSFNLRNKKVFSFKKNKIKEIKISHQEGNSIQFAKKGNKWHMTFPLNTEVNRYEFGKLLDDIEGLKITQVISEQEENLEKYKLNNPLIEVRITDAENKTEELLISQKNFSYYVKLKNSQKIFIIEYEKCTDFKNAVNDPEKFRNRQLLYIEEIEKIKEIEISSKEIEINCVKIKDKWLMKKPIKALADKYEIEKIIGDISNLYVIEFKEEKPLNLYGLDKPNLIITLKDPNGYKQLFIGKKEKKTKSPLPPYIETELYYAKTNLSSQVFTIDSIVFEKIPQRKEDIEKLRDRAVFSFKNEEINSLEVKIQNLNIILTKKGKKDIWKLISPFEREIPAEKINTFLWMLQGLRVKEFIPYQNLKVKTMEVILKINNKTQILIIGEEDSKKMGFYTRVDKEKEIYFIEKYQIYNLKKEITKIIKRNDEQ